jgi:CheY-like chemotaxis protein
MDTVAPEAPPVVLVVDDEELLRLLATEFPEDAGFKTVEACNVSKS